MNQREVWDALAESWARLRTKPQEGVEEFLCDKNGLILDIGCGNGRNLIAGKRYIGMDFSPKAIRFAKERAKRNIIDATFVVGGAAELPFKDNSFDHILLVATLHVLERDKRQCLNEIKRVLKKSGQVLITVWNKNQLRFFFSKKEELVPWEVDDKKYMRYYYLFTKCELKSLLEKNDFEVLRISGSRKKAFKLFPMDIIAIVRRR